MDIHTLGQVHLISIINKCVIKAKFENHDNSVLKVLFYVYFCTFHDFSQFKKLKKKKKLVLITMKWYSSSRLKDGNMDDRCGLMILCASQ